MRYRVVPLPPVVADEARRTGVAPGWGHPVHREVATGYGPCRVCLRTFDEGADRRLLFTFDPFEGLESLPLPGPVFVHEDPCSPYAEEGRFPAGLAFLPLTLNAYGPPRLLREAIRLEPHGDLDSAIDELLRREDVEYVHVRNTEAGCYVCRIERAAPPPAPSSETRDQPR